MNYPILNGFPQQPPPPPQGCNLRWVDATHIGVGGGRIWDDPTGSVCLVLGPAEQEIDILHAGFGGYDGTGPVLQGELLAVWAVSKKGGQIDVICSHAFIASSVVLPAGALPANLAYLGHFHTKSASAVVQAFECIANAYQRQYRMLEADAAQQLAVGHAIASGIVSSASHIVSPRTFAADLVFSTSGAGPYTASSIEVHTRFGAPAGVVNSNIGTPAGDGQIYIANASCQDQQVVWDFSGADPATLAALAILQWTEKISS